MFNKNIPQASYLCEICENLIFLAKSMSPKLNLPIQTNTHTLVKAYSCDSSSKSCMYSTCDESCDTGLKVEYFKDDNTEIQFYQWKEVGKKVQKIDSILPPDDLITLLYEEVRVLKNHIFIKRQ